jgi:hypothetical protein
MIEVRKGTPYGYEGATDGYGGCPLCSVLRSDVLTLVEADPINAALESRAYACADCRHSQTYCVDAGDN